MDFQREKNEDFQRQTIEIVRDDALLQRSNLMMILCQKKTTIEVFMLAKSNNGLLCENRILMCCLTESFHIHNSENHQQKMWIISLKKNMIGTEKMFRSWDHTHFWDELYLQKLIVYEFILQSSKKCRFVTG